jgi:hypothetical protein
MKRRVLFLAVVISALFALHPAAAQEPGPASVPAFEHYTRGLGFSGGVLSGVGLSYRQWIGRLGYQIVAGGYYSPGEYASMDYWVATEGYYSLYSAEFADWFYNQLYLFVGVIHHGYMYDGPYVPEVGAGGGIGIEAGWFQHLSTSFEIGYGAFWPFSVQLAVQGAFHYRF